MFGFGYRYLDPLPVMQRNHRPDHHLWPRRAVGDARLNLVLALRAVTSVDGMTADFFPYDMNFLGRAATRIINEVKGVNRVVYDVTSKPPGTIEWE